MKTKLVLTLMSMLWPFSMIGVLAFASPITWSGKTPSELFLAPSDDSAVVSNSITRSNQTVRPRMLLMVGLSGSGKSTWANAARKNGWTVVCPDEIRHELLQDRVSQCGTVQLKSGDTVAANLNLMSHLFCPEFKRKGIEIAKAQISDLLEKKQDFVYDATNVTLSRVFLLIAARQAGYSVSALVFLTEDPGININNVILRGRSGGSDIADPDDRNAQEKRLESISAQYENFKRYPIQKHQQKSEEFLLSQPLPQLAFDSEVFFNPAQMEAALGSNSQVIDILKEYDVYDQIEYVDVLDWSTQGI